VVAVRTRSSLVLGHPGALATMRAIAAVTDAGVPHVSAVWGTDWTQRVVVLVPATQTELGQIIEEGNDLSQIAAVATAGLAGTGSGPVGERIVINPPNFAKLGAIGRLVVLRHEMTHVASRALTSGSTPTWLAEGFADYVGYLDSGVAIRDAGRELAVDLRKGTVPTALPADEDFSGTNTALPQVYEMSWLACRLIAARTTQAGLVRFYRDVSAEGGDAQSAVAAVLQRQLHLTMAQFTALWRSYLHQQLS
jgi:hypothetical protein